MADADGQAYGLMGGPDNGADGMAGDLFGVSQDGVPQVPTGPDMGKAFVEALGYIERHQLPVDRLQAAGLMLLRALDGGRGTLYARIADEAERLRLLGGPATDFIQGLQAMALAARPRMMAAQAPSRRRGLFGR